MRRKGGCSKPKHNLHILPFIGVWSFKIPHTGDYWISWGVWKVAPKPVEAKATSTARVLRTAKLTAMPTSTDTPRAISTANSIIRHSRLVHQGRYFNFWKPAYLPDPAGPTSVLNNFGDLKILQHLECPKAMLHSLFYYCLRYQSLYRLWIFPKGGGGGNRHIHKWTSQPMDSINQGPNLWK